MLLDGLGRVALVLLEEHDPGCVGVLGDYVDRGAFAIERIDVVADVAQVLAMHRRGDATDLQQPVGVVGEPVGQAHSASATTALGVEDCQSLIQAVAILVVTPPRRFGVVLTEALGRPAAHAVGVVVVVGNLPIDRAILARTRPGSEHQRSPVVEVSTQDV